MPSDTFNLNIEIADLPKDVNIVIEMLRAARGVTKKAIIREALIEYAQRHKGDIVKQVGKKS